MSMEPQRPDSKARQTEITSDPTDNQTENRSGNLDFAFSASEADMPPTPPHQDEAKDGQEKSYKRWGSLTERFLLIVEILGFFAIIWYCVLTRSELAVFDYERQTMQDEFRTAKSNMEMDQRAWLAPYYCEVRNAPEDTSQTVFRVNFKNTGKTPAVRVQMVISNIWGDIPLSKHDSNPNATAGMMAPEAAAWIDSIPLVRAQTDIINGKNFRVAGTIWYDDIFGHHHWSEFAYWVILSPPVQFQPTLDHNSCDDAEAAQGK